MCRTNPCTTFPDGFPKELIEAFESKTGRRVLCNKPYSGTQVLQAYGRRQIETGRLIVYTSADSVFQIAAHEQYIGLEELYRCCEIARSMLTGAYAVGRVIARPYIGEYPDFQRTRNRHDYALPPPRETMLDILKAAGYDVIAIGKINDIFAGRGMTDSMKTSGNFEGMCQTIRMTSRDFQGLCFVNLVDFDMVYGHRNDIEGYARAVSEFDSQLGELLGRLNPDDILMITADHGCDPGTKSTDHSREYVPLLIYGERNQTRCGSGHQGQLCGYRRDSAGNFRAAVVGAQLLAADQKRGVIWIRKNSYARRWNIEGALTRPSVNSRWELRC